MFMTYLVLLTCYLLPVVFSAVSYPPAVVCAPGNPVLLAPSPFIPVENKDCDYTQTYPRKPPKWFYSPPVSKLSSYILSLSNKLTCLSLTFRVRPSHCTYIHIYYIYIYTVPIKSLHAPFIFSHFVMLQPMY